MMLNDSSARNAKAGVKLYRLRDGEGLFLVVRPSGSKTWQFRYIFGVKEKTISFGKYPEVSLSEARDRKIEARKLLRQGVDPSDDRRKQRRQVAVRSVNTFNFVAKEWFDQNSPNWTERHAERTWRRLELHVLPTLGRRSVLDIEPLDLLVTLQKIEAKYTSHRVLQICSVIFNYCVITGRVQRNIALGLSKGLGACNSKNYPTLAADEISGFLEAFESLKTTSQNKVAFMLLLLTSVRTGEMRYAKWCHVDFDKKEWVIPAENTKMRTTHLVPLSSQSVELLDSLISRRRESDYLFPNQQSQKHPVMSENTINHMIDRMGYKGRIVGHGFRSLFSSVLNENGFNRDAIERQLAHLERNKVRAAYNRAEYIEERRKMMQWWADYIYAKMPKGKVAEVPESKGKELLGTTYDFEGSMNYSYGVWPNVIH